MAEMMRSPDDLRRLQQELANVLGLDRTVDEPDLDKLPFLRCVVKETLRMHPPGVADDPEVSLAWSRTRSGRTVGEARGGSIWPCW